MAILGERTLTSLNALVDEQALEIAGLKKELHNLRTSVDDRFDIVNAKLDILINNMNKKQDSDKGK